MAVFSSGCGWGAAGTTKLCLVSPQGSIRETKHSLVVQAAPHTCAEGEILLKGRKGKARSRYAAAGRKPRRRSELVSTETELRAIAPAASVGESRSPKNG